MKITISIYENEPENARTYSVEMRNEVKRQEMIEEFDNLLLTMFAPEPKEEIDAKA